MWIFSVFYYLRTSSRDFLMRYGSNSWSIDNCCSLRFNGNCCLCLFRPWWRVTQETGQVTSNTWTTRTATGAASPASTTSTRTGTPRCVQGPLTSCRSVICRLWDFVLVLMWKKQQKTIWCLFQSVTLISRHVNRTISSVTLISWSLLLFRSTAASSGSFPRGNHTWPTSSRCSTGCSSSGPTAGTHTRCSPPTPPGNQPTNQSANQLVILTADSRSGLFRWCWALLTSLTSCNFIEKLVSRKSYW